jgi:hypothetical protein
MAEWLSFIHPPREDFAGTMITARGSCARLASR